MGGARGGASHEQIPDVTSTSPVLKEERRRKKKKERNQLQRPPHPPLARREAIVRSGNNPLTLTSDGCVAMVIVVETIVVGLKLLEAL